MMDSLSLFGLLAVTAMLVAYALEERSHWFILAFAGACALGSVYGLRGSRLLFRQSANPFSALYRCALRRVIKSVSTRDCAEFSVWMLTVSFRPTTARGSSVTPMSAATQPIMPSSVPSSNRAEDGQPNSENTCSSRCR